MLIALVPVQEIEAWMLADKELLKKEIGTEKTDIELTIHRSPEKIANPKEVIEEAIRVAREGMVKRRRAQLTLADIYSPIGQKIGIEKLDNLNSYQDFKENIRSAFRRLKLLD